MGFPVLLFFRPFLPGHVPGPGLPALDPADLAFFVFQPVLEPVFASHAPAVSDMVARFFRIPAPWQHQILLHRLERAVLQYENILPPVPLAGLERAAVRVKPVGQDADRKTGIISLELRRQAGEGLAFAILLVELTRGILDPFAGQRQAQSVPCHQLGLQHVMEVGRGAVFGSARQAMGAMPVVKADHPGGVNRHRVILAAKAIPPQYLLPEQARHQVHLHRLRPLRVRMLQNFGDRVAMRQPGTEALLERLGESRLAALVVDPVTGILPEQEHAQAAREQFTHRILPALSVIRNRR